MAPRLAARVNWAVTAYQQLLADRLRVLSGDQPTTLGARGDFALSTARRSQPVANSTM